VKRIIVGLKSARRMESRPPGIPVGRPRGQKAFGIRYEKALAKWAGIPVENRGVWFEFEDKNGPGCCQVDFLVPFGAESIVLELKHTWTEDGHVELEKLYLPVVSLALGQPIRGVVVAKRLVPGMHGVFGSLQEAAMSGVKRPVWHWIGGTAPFPSHRKGFWPKADNSVLSPRPLAG